MWIKVVDKRVRLPGTLLSLVVVAVMVMAERVVTAGMMWQ